MAHGSTGKGNDQVRFESSVWALDPDIEVLAPVRDWEFKSREEEIEYALKHGIPVKATKRSLTPTIEICGCCNRSRSP